MARRFISIALPHLAAEYRLRREGAAGAPFPFAVVAEEGSARRLASVSPAAAAAGLAPGMGLADARALCPRLVTRPAEPARLAAFRRGLMRWAGRFSPLIGEDNDGALVLDVSGCAHLFGGEAAMLDTIRDALAGLGFSARLAMADTRGGAWALAHYGDSPCTLAPMGRTRARLAPLPVAALRLERDAAESLAAAGLARIGDIAGLPRGALARRFGLATLRRLDQALGAEPEPVSPARARALFRARLGLPEPIGHTADVAAGLARLLERLCRRLEAEQRGARRLRLIARRVDGGDRMAEIRLARPMRDPARLGALFAPGIERLDAGFGIDALTLDAPETEPMAPVQTTPGECCESAPLADLLTRIGNRVGFEHVIRFLPAESHIPERAFTAAAAAWSAPADWGSADWADTARSAMPPRPLTLVPPEPLAPCPPGGPGPARGWVGGSGGGSAGGTGIPGAPPPPGRFHWRGQALSVLRARGPERLTPEWWWDDPAWRSGLRDYWRVATAEGPRLWLFHTPTETPRPRWWVAGLFA